jgi:hypothetical protein
MSFDELCAVRRGPASESVGRANLPAELDAGHPREVPVEHEEIEVLLAGALERLFGGRRGGSTMSPTASSIAPTTSRMSGRRRRGARGRSGLASGDRSCTDCVRLVDRKGWAPARNEGRPAARIRLASGLANVCKCSQSRFSKESTAAPLPPGCRAAGGGGGWARPSRSRRSRAPTRRRSRSRPAAGAAPGPRCLRARAKSTEDFEAEADVAHGAERTSAAAVTQSGCRSHYARRPCGSRFSGRVTWEARWRASRGGAATTCAFGARGWTTRCSSLASGARPHPRLKLKLDGIALLRSPRSLRRRSGRRARRARGQLRRRGAGDDEGGAEFARRAGAQRDEGPARVRRAGGWTASTRRPGARGAPGSLRARLGPREGDGDRAGGSHVDAVRRRSLATRACARKRWPATASS